MTIEQSAEEYAKEIFPNDEFKQAEIVKAYLKGVNECSARCRQLIYEVANEAEMSGLPLVYTRLIKLYSKVHILFGA